MTQVHSIYSNDGLIVGLATWVTEILARLVCNQEQSCPSYPVAVLFETHIPFHTLIVCCPARSYQWLCVYSRSYAAGGYGQGDGPDPGTGGLSL